MKNSCTPKPNACWPFLGLQLRIALAISCVLSLTSAFSQVNDTPCECSQRWERGDKWDGNGGITSPGADPNGIIRCGNGAETQSNVIVEYQCKYDPNEFQINLPVGGCPDPLNPNSGMVWPTAPTPNKPIIWFNFDTRAGVMEFQAQWNDNDAADNIGWALYYSMAPTASAGAAPHYQSGNCGSLQFHICGVESGNTWYMIAPPSAGTTNWYLAIWDQNGDDDLDINNFKARKACGQVTVACLEIVCPDPDGGDNQCLSDIPSEQNTAAGIEVVTNCPGNVSYTHSDAVTGSCLTNDLQVARTTTVTFTPNDGSPAISETCTIVYYVDDTTAPVAPAAPAAAAYQCATDVPPPGSLTATDNCAGNITVTGVDASNGGAGCANSPLVITRTWTFSDACGNSSSVSQTITVVDTEAPDAYDPADVTNASCVNAVPCPSPNDPTIAAVMAEIESNSTDCHSFTVALKSATGLRTCSLDDNGNYTFGRTFTFRLTDACGNFSDVEVKFSGACQPICNYSQGAWGNSGGSPGVNYPAFGNDVALINHLILNANYGNGKIRIGNQTPGNTEATSKFLDITSSASVLTLLPGGGTPAALASMVGCTKAGPAYCNPKGNDGSLKNTLATQTIALQLNIWLSQYSGMNLSTENLNCVAGIPADVLTKLTQYGLPQTVGGLLTLCNNTLGGEATGIASSLTTAADKVIHNWHECNQPTGPCSAPLLLAGANLVENSFDAWKIAQKVALRWMVRHSLDVERFVIERSLDGIDYQLLMEVPVVGGDRPDSYAAIDYMPEKGINYYQLVAYLKNGEVVVLPEQQVEFGFKKAFSIIPNPAQNEAFLDLTMLANRKDVTLTVTNLYGQTVLTKQIEAVSASFERLDVAELGEDVYFVSIRVGREIYSTKLLITRGE